MLYAGRKRYTRETDCCLLYDIFLRRSTTKRCTNPAVAPDEPLMLQAFPQQCNRTKSVFPASSHSLPCPSLYQQGQQNMGVPTCKSHPKPYPQLPSGILLVRALLVPHTVVARTAVQERASPRCWRIRVQLILLLCMSSRSLPFFVPAVYPAAAAASAAATTTTKFCDQSPGKNVSG